MQGTRTSLRAPRRFGVLAIAVTLVATACDPGTASPPAGSGTPSPTSLQSQAPSSPTATSAGGTVKVGFISPTTGFVAALGTDMKRGWELYWELNGNTAGGVTVDTVFEDDAGDPEVALTKARRLVEQEDVDITAGPILANTAYAVADYVGVTGRAVVPHHRRGRPDPAASSTRWSCASGYTSSQSNFPAGQWAYDEGHRNAVTICPDYAFGWESCGGFVSGFTDAGGTIGTQIWHPLGTQDFSTYVTQASAAQPGRGLHRLGRRPRRHPVLEGLDRLRAEGHGSAHRKLLLRRPGAPARPGRGRDRHRQLQLLDGGRDSEEVRAFVEAYENAARRDPLAVCGRARTSWPRSSRARSRRPAAWSTARRSSTAAGADIRRQRLRADRVRRHQQHRRQRLPRARGGTGRRRSTGTSSTRPSRTSASSGHTERRRSSRTPSSAATTPGSQ